MNDTEQRCKQCGWEPHAGPDSCPTWYDGCNCSPQTVAAYDRFLAEVEVKLLEPHTWEQERAAIAQYVRQSSLTLDLAQIAERVVQGKHWPEGEKS